MGPHGYISSSWFDGPHAHDALESDATAQYLVDIELIDDNPAATDEIVGDLIGAMEAGRPGRVVEARRWGRDTRDSSPASSPSGRTSAQRRVKFKLGQDERDSEYADIMRALATAGGDRTLLKSGLAGAPRRRRSGSDA